jgi:fibronectin-binding autotransporter adhesin
MSRPPVARLGLCSALFSLVLTAAPSSAQTPTNYYWNTPNGGAGTWDNGVTMNWGTTPTASPPDYTWTNSGFEIANFGGTAGGTVTLGSSINVNALTFTTDGYTLAAGNTLTLMGAGGIIDTGGVNAAINSVIAGASGLTKNSAGTLTLTGTNTYTGVTNINAGTVVFTSTAALGNTGAGNDTVVANGASLTIGDNAINITSELLTLNGTGVGNNGALRKIGTTNSSWGATITLGSATRIDSDTTGLFTISGAINGGSNGLTIGGSGNTTISGLVTTSGTLAKDGAGTLTLSNTSNALTGAVSITGGVVSIPSTLALGTTGTVTLNGGTLRETNPGNAGSFISSTRTIAIGPNGGTVDYSSSAPSVGLVTLYAGTITGPGNTLTKTGMGEFRYQGAGTANSTFSKLVVNQGLFRIGNATGSSEVGFGAVPASPTPDAITLNGGAIGDSLTLTLNANRGITLGPNGGTIDMGAAPMTIPGVISGSGSLTKIGSQLLTVSGANTYTGATSIQGGVMTVNTLANGGSASAIGSAANTAGNLVLSGGSLQYTGAGASTDRLFSITSAGGTLDASGAGTVTFTNTGSILSTDKAAAAFTVTNTSTAVVLAPGATPADLVGIAVGMPVSGTGIAAGTTVTAVSTIGFTLSAAATATGTPSLTFGSLNRTLTLTGTNTGDNTLAGVLANSPTATLSLVKAGAGTWALTGANTYSGTTTINAGTLKLGGDNRLPVGTVVNFGTAAATQLDMTNRLQTIGGLSGNLATNSSILLGTGTLTVNQTADETYSGAISGAGGTLVKNGSNLLVLDGANTFAGGLTIGGGTLQIGFAAATGSIDPNVPITNNGTLQVAKTTALSLGGNITGSGGLSKVNSGTLTLSGTNTYAGTTTINGGTLLVNGNQSGAAGAVSVLSGTLGGTGTVGGAVTVNINGTFSGTLRAGDANAVGTLTLANGLSTVAGSNLAVRISDPGASGVAAGSGGSTVGLPNPTNHNYVLVTGGSSTIDPGMNIVVDGTGLTFTAGVNYSYKVAQLTGNQSAVNITAPGQFTFVGFSAQSASLTGNATGAIFLDFTPVPEPGTVFAVAAAGLGLAGLARRSRRQAAV